MMLLKNANGLLCESWNFLSSEIALSTILESSAVVALASSKRRFIGTARKPFSLTVGEANGTTVVRE